MCIINEETCYIFEDHIHFTFILYCFRLTYHTQQPKSIEGGGGERDCAHPTSTWCPLALTYVFPTVKVMSPIQTGMIGFHSIPKSQPLDVIKSRP